MAVGEAVQTAPKCGPTYQSAGEQQVPILPKRQGPVPSTRRNVPATPSASARQPPFSRPGCRAARQWCAA